MKKLVLSTVIACAALSVSAQEYLHVNSHWYGQYIPIAYIDSITYGDLDLSQRLPNVMANDPNISIFNEALRVTHLCDSLMDCWDYGFWDETEIAPKYQSNAASVPAIQKIRKGYTAFVETDAVYAHYGIKNIDDLKEYAAKVYDEMYPEDASVSDPTDRRNSLNRFVSYHLLYVKAEKYQLTVAGIDRSERGNGKIAGLFDRNKIDIADWYETLMPYSLMKCSSPLLDEGETETVFINRRGLQDHADDRGVLIEGVEIIDQSYGAENGIYHYIDGIIAYDKQTQEVVLDEQIIVNNTTMTPEFFNNDLRISISEEQRQYVGVGFHAGSLKNIDMQIEKGYLYYLFNDFWRNIQTDEFLIPGMFDVCIKLPAVPAGTYELNLGYYANNLRPVVCTYLDEMLCDTLDLRLYYSDLWMSDVALNYDEALMAENDSLLFVNGCRKGLDYCYDPNSMNETLRDVKGAFRRIITTFTTDGKTDHYLRIKNVTENPTTVTQFHLDFIELCPTHLLKEYK